MKIKAYTKSELALMYNPTVSVSRARKILAEWIDTNVNLKSRLESMGYSKKIRLLTPPMVKEIVEVFLEP